MLTYAPRSGLPPNAANRPKDSLRR
jgi:hypothetical protein